ncbi:MAG: hypothetical protein H0V37_11560 [Chloroflexia bacterium]|nr:hypothetical protein [Chloroflexia bacterium]
MIRGRDFLPVGQFLEKLAGEASERTRTGRAYYAAFLEARQFCEDRLGYERVKSGGEHVTVPRLMATVDAKLEVDLAFLRQLRNHADYDLHFAEETIWLQLLDAVDQANEIIARLDELAAPGTDA